MHFPRGHNCAIVSDEAKKAGKIGLDIQLCSMKYKDGRQEVTG